MLTQISVKRLPYLDFLRCFAIVMVIGLHAIAPYIGGTAFYGSRFWMLCVLGNELARTGVPLFFMLSGFLMLRDSRTSDIAGFYKKRLARLLPPLLVWNVVYFLYNAYNAGQTPNLLNFLAKLLYKGSGYHMWFVYTLLGIYLLAPFLKRLADVCTQRQLWVLLGVVIFPGTLRPLLNSVQPLFTIHLFDPLVENYVGYFLLGYLLGSAELGKKTVWIISAGGIAGYLLGVWGNLAASSADAVSLPANVAYGVNHYLLAAAVFVLAIVFFERFRGNFGRLETLSGVVFGVYWVHVLVLEWVCERLQLNLSPSGLIGLQTCLTIAISFALMLVFARIPVLRRVIM